MGLYHVARAVAFLNIDCGLVNPLPQPTFLHTGLHAYLHVGSCLLKHSAVRGAGAFSYQCGQ